MNHLRRFLTNNFDLTTVKRAIFYNKPIILDHIAHRTFKGDTIMSNYLKDYNCFYLENDLYKFDKQNAYAEWLNIKEDKYNTKYTYDLYKLIKNKKIEDNNIIGTPRIFVSTYSGIYNDNNFLSSNLDLDLINWHISNPNEKLSYDLYKEIYDKNQYLAWTLVFRNRINHIGIQVDDINETYKKVKNILSINNPDSPIQVSLDGNLLQFSTKSTFYPYKFKEGNFEIPRNFIEFVQRKKNREGFSEKNASVVFNSTSSN